MGNLKETRQAKIIHLTQKAKDELRVKAAKNRMSMKAYLEFIIEKDLTNDERNHNQ